MEELILYLERICNDGRKMMHLIHNRNRHIEIELRFDAIDKTKAAQYFQSLDPSTETRVEEVNCGTTSSKEVRKRHFPAERYSETKELVCCRHFPMLSLSVHSNIENRFYETFDVSKLTARTKIRRSQSHDGYRIDVTRIEKDGRSVWMVELELTSYEVCSSITAELERLTPLVVTSDLAHSTPGVLRFVEGKVTNWTKPREAFTYDFTEKAFFSRPTYVTAKLDGLRKLIWVKNGIVYGGSETESFREYGRCDGPDCLLDAEMYDERIYPFDLVIFKNKNVTHRPFRYRIKLAEKVTRECGFSWKAQLLVDRFDAIPNAVCTIKAYDVRTDGVIFTQASGKYSVQPLKWKYSPTIDVYIKEGIPYARRNKAMMKIPDRYAPKDIVGIYECEVPAEGPLIVVRERKDKVAPNSHAVVATVLRAVRRGHILSFDGLCGKTAALIRAYHNRVKHQLLQEVRSNLIDIGSGTGGDVGKWDRIKTVYAVEPNEDSFAQLRRRATHNVKIFNRTGQRLDFNDIKQVSHISLFFSLNAMGSAGLAELLRNVARRPECFVNKTVHLLILFMEWPGSPREFDFATLRELDDRHAEVTIRDSKVIEIREEKMSLDNLTELLTRHQYTVTHIDTLNKENFMSEQQKKFTSMYKCIKAIRSLN